MLLPEILVPHVYNFNSPIEVANNLREELIPYVSDSVKQSQSSKLEEYINIVSDYQYKILVRSLASDLMEVIYRNFPNIQFGCEGRFKSLVSFVEKMLYLQSKERSLDTLKDIIGLRIITTNATIKELYEVARIVFNFFTLQNFMPCNLKTTESKNFVSSMYPSIEVPKKSYLSKHIVQYAKDYVVDPKKNGYQSIHFVFFDSRTKRYIEIQLRTHEMDTHASYGEKPITIDDNNTKIEESNNEKTSADARHDKYKANRKYLVPHEEVDIQKISMSGFIAVSPTEFSDRCGLIEAKSIILLN